MSESLFLHVAEGHSVIVCAGVDFSWNGVDFFVLDLCALLCFGFCFCFCFFVFFRFFCQLPIATKTSQERLNEREEEIRSKNK